MNFKKIEDLEKKYYAGVFSRLPVAVDHGKGVYLYDVKGKRYLDFFAGIAVNVLGHCHPKVTKTIAKQAGMLVHTSNWLYTKPQLELAKLLTKITKQDRVFFTNDGTEAVEAAIKLVRSTTGKKEIIAMKNAFHGRTLGSLSLTWDEKFRKPFEPLVPGVKFVEYNNVKKLESAITGNTAAVILEPIQGEAGVIIPDVGYLKKVREMTEREGVLLVLDEVQTGLGRTGKLFAYEHEDVKPDILCLGKALGNGFPIGAALYNGMDFKTVEHGGTFVGNPLACAVSKTVVETVINENLPKKSAKLGLYLLKELKEGLGLRARGRGLMMGIEVKDGKKTVLDLIERSVLTIHTKNTVRILPPLIIEKKHADLFLERIGSLRV